MMTDEDLRARVDILVEFLEVAFHSILFYRKIYPETIFVLKKKYEVAVHISIHPDLNKYITNCLETLKQLLKQNRANEVTLTICSESGAPLEKYKFQISHAPCRTSVEDSHFVRTEESFRKYLLKLCLIEHDLALSCEEGAVFTIDIGTTEDSSVWLNELLSQFHFPWVQKDELTIQDKRIVPVTSVDTLLLKMDMFVEDYNIPIHI